MTFPSLRALYGSHQGKVSDKWSIYLDVYERLFAQYRQQAVRLLEIGVQNGGSLEIWSQYFSQAVSFVGCDIDPACGQLRFSDPRVKIVVGDANAADVQAAIAATSPEFDIVIDDGSHTSNDIVDSFARYFPQVRRGGIYIAEDLHCSYWREFGGGLFDPTSSISFFKRLVDITNHEHWGVPGRRSDILRSFAQTYGLEFSEPSLAEIHSVEFVNSMCIVRKDAPAANLLGERHFSGSIEAVQQRGSAPPVSRNLPLQDENRWSRLGELPEEELAHAHADVELGRKELASQQQRMAELTDRLARAEQDLAREQALLQRARESLAQTERHVSDLQATFSWRVTRPLRVVRSFLDTKNKRNNG